MTSGSESYGIRNYPKNIFGCTSLAKVILTEELVLRVPATWKIKTSVGLPEIVISAGMLRVG
jgi:hypothetical protein